jgi:hypothetical protein
MKGGRYANFSGGGGVKVLTSFSGNMKRLVSMKDLSIKGKAHDCHVMLTVLLPIAIRAIKPKYLKMVITRVCYFFNKRSLALCVLNQAFRESSMVERYHTKEVIKCCQEYLQDKRGIILLDSWHKGRLAGKSTSWKKVFMDKNFTAVEHVHYSMLQQLQLVAPYIEEHLDVIRAESNGCTDDWIEVAQASIHSFVQGDSNDERILHRLLQGPLSQVTSWKG